ncbi:hypothetical protein [Thiolapillus sp.]|uniref:hypothetical protein n=1 Tax=Thiolapillus sp. TaxID=2017437 RepID=UPI0027397CA2|nr:hypothetical protein [Thiolapillus sp.]
MPQPSWSPSTTQQLRKLVAAPYLAPNDWTPRSEAYFVFPLAQGTPGKQCGLAATGVYQPSLRSPWLAAMVLYWQVSRCRHLRFRESLPGDTSPQVGQQCCTPSSCSTCTVTSPSDSASSTPDTCQGLLIPSIWAYRSLSLIGDYDNLPTPFGEEPFLQSPFFDEMPIIGPNMRLVARSG